jgi:hypothetical protein
MIWNCIPEDASTDITKTSDRYATTYKAAKATITNATITNVIMTDVTTTATTTEHALQMWGGPATWRTWNADYICKNI